MHPNLKSYSILILFFLIQQGYSQIYNTQVEAKLQIEEQNDLLSITGTAYNKSEINQSLRYVLSTIRANPDNTNRSKNDQSGRIVLEPGEQQNLSQTTINRNENDRIIILLLIYDTEDNILGQDRYVMNDTMSDNEVKEQLQEQIQESIYQQDVDATSGDGLVLRGIVIEDTKTKPGRDFYNYFYSAYNANNINGDRIVTVKEVLAIGNNTKIEVYVGDDKVVEFFLRPQNDFIKQMSDAAIRRVAQHFERLKREANIIRRY